MHTFRPVLDGAFFPTDLFDRFKNGEFAKEFERRRLELLIGEVRDEVSRISPTALALFRWADRRSIHPHPQETIYRQTNPPDSLETLHLQVSNYYPSHVTDKLIDAYLNRKVHLPYAHPDPDPNIDAWKKVYGDISTSNCPRFIISVHRYELHDLNRSLANPSFRWPSPCSLPPPH